ncbi:MAG: hypothetical protein ACREMP_00400 [Candidatus Tyrphobacter sp.]
MMNLFAAAASALVVLAALAVALLQPAPERHVVPARVLAERPVAAAARLERHRVRSQRR